MIFFAKPQREEDASEDEDFQQKTAQHGAHHDVARVVELVEDIHQAEDHGRGKHVAADYPPDQGRRAVYPGQRILSAPQAAQDPDQRERDQRPPPNEAGEDPLRSVSEFGNPQKGENDYSDV